jgi:hypothetical protein
MSWSRVSPPCWPASPRPQGGHWVYEPKRDGFRGLLVRRGARAPAVWRRGASGGERHFAWPLSWALKYPLKGLKLLSLA